MGKGVLAYINSDLLITFWLVLTIKLRYLRYTVQQQKALTIVSEKDLDQSVIILLDCNVYRGITIYISLFHHITIFTT